MEEIRHPHHVEQVDQLEQFFESNQIEFKKIK